MLRTVILPMLLVSFLQLGQMPTPGQSTDASIPAPALPPVLHIGGDVKPPVLISHVEPHFSDTARAEHKSGNVKLFLWVTAEGLPSHLRVVQSVGYGLDEEAVNAVRQYRFKPATRNGEPVTVDVYIDVNFQFKDH
jgi:TonB family protein